MSDSTRIQKPTLQQENASSLSQGVPPAVSNQAQTRQPNNTAQGQSQPQPVAPQSQWNVRLNSSPDNSKPTSTRFTANKAGQPGTAYGSVVLRPFTSGRSVYLPPGAYTVIGTRNTRATAEEDPKGSNNGGILAPIIPIISTVIITTLKGVRTIVDLILEMVPNASTISDLINGILGAITGGFGGGNNSGEDQPAKPDPIPVPDPNPASSFGGNGYLAPRARAVYNKSNSRSRARRSATAPRTKYRYPGIFA